MLEYYDNNLFAALSDVFPNVTFEESKFIQLSKRGNLFSSKFFFHLLISFFSLSFFFFSFRTIAEEAADEERAGEPRGGQWK